jgi:hypothetical protein
VTDIWTSEKEEALLAACAAVRQQEEASGVGDMELTLIMRSVVILYDTILNRD